VRRKASVRVAGAVCGPSTADYGFTAWVMARRGGRSGPAAIVPLTLIAVIGPARIREGKHWRSDVVAGYLLGASWLALLIALARRTAEGEAAAVDGALGTAEPARAKRESPLQPEGAALGA
jgi:membrane-associated phospholipid phosphatase